MRRFLVNEKMTYAIMRIEIFNVIKIYSQKRRRTVNVQVSISFFISEHYQLSACV